MNKVINKAIEAVTVKVNAITTNIKTKGEINMTNQLSVSISNAIKELRETNKNVSVVVRGIKQIDLYIDKPVTNVPKNVVNSKNVNKAGVCADCGFALTSKNVVDYSTKKYGRALCGKCQDKVNYTKKCEVCNEPVVYTSKENMMSSMNKAKSKGLKYAPYHASCASSELTKLNNKSPQEMAIESIKSAPAPKLAPKPVTTNTVKDTKQLSVDITYDAKPVSPQPIVEVVTEESITDSLNAKTIVELKAMLKEAGLKVSGNKSDLIHRLMLELYIEEVAEEVVVPENKFPISDAELQERGRQLMNYSPQYPEEDTELIPGLDIEFDSNMITSFDLSNIPTVNFKQQ